MHPILTLALILAAQTATAEVCDFRPSIMAGKAGSAARNVATGAANQVKAVGAYTLENPVTGATMISSGVRSATAAGTSIATGASGALGTATAIATAPVTIVIAGLTAVALGGYEGACYFKAERITDYDEILYIMQNLSDNSDPTLFALIQPGTDYVTLEGKNATAGEAKIRVAATGIGPFIFDVRKLYISDGVLMHRDRLRNTVIGNVGLQIIQTQPE
jgi:hypothetical protein